MHDRSPAGAFPSSSIADRLLDTAIAAAPRRYRMPPLPATAEQAMAAGPDAAVAFAMEHARVALAAGTAPSQELQSVFTRGLAGLIRAALDPDSGDASFQALVLRSGEPALREFIQLNAASAADRRAVRSLVDAFAHPGKLRHEAAASMSVALTQLHRLAFEGPWAGLRSAAAQLAADHAIDDDAVMRGLHALLASASLGRLVRGEALREHASVQRYLALCDRSGPRAGSDEASAAGRGAALAGATAERATVRAFRQVAELLDRFSGGHPLYRACRGLRLPRGFPNPAPNAKDEWDVALLRLAPGGAADLVLLAEVKAAPAAAAPDLPRLLRGLQRLASVAPDEDAVFPTADGQVRISGRSLSRLAPVDSGIPRQVIYCCPASAPTQARPLTPAAKAVLLAEEASLAHARALARGEAPPESGLAPVWQALAGGRLRSALHQYETARRSREAMLDPAELVDALAALVGQ